MHARCVVTAQRDDPDGNKSLWPPLESALRAFLCTVKQLVLYFSCLQRLCAALLA
jgi:hypothetical protein|eukprot:COSAG01_NODE_299_length_19246_cov_62.028827_7_plen_55_part_00